MAYQTGVASSASDLLSTLFTFLTSHGFTVEANWTYTFGSVTHDVRTISKDGVFYTFAVTLSGVTYLWMNTATALIESGFLFQQTGAHGNDCRVDNLQGPYVGYHFFYDGLTVNVAVEIVTNVFVHFNFGLMDKNGAYTGGAFVTGLNIFQVSGASLTSPFDERNHLPFDVTAVGGVASGFIGTQGHVRSPVSGQTAQLGRGLTSNSHAYSTGNASNVGRELLTLSPNVVNGRAVLVPINIVQASSASAGPFYQLGTISNARFVNITNLNPKELVNTDWMVFPISQKNGPGSVYLNSSYLGLAYKQ